jgi:hypothetical protein
VGSERSAQRRGSCDCAGLLWDSSWPAKRRDDQRPEFYLGLGSGCVEKQLRCAGQGSSRCARGRDFVFIGIRPREGKRLRHAWMETVAVIDGLKEVTVFDGRRGNGWGNSY